MADGSTSNYSLILPEIDGAEGTWGTSINTNLSNLDSLLSGGTTLTAIVVDNVKIDGSNIGTVGDPDLITVGTNTVTVAGTLNATALTGPLTGDVTGNVTGNVTATGITVDGTVTADNFTLTRTAGSTVASLEMFTDSNNDTFISERDADNGSLKILGTTLQLRADDLTLRDRAGNDLYLKGHINGATNLYYDYSTYNTPKLATTATGVTVTGTVTADGLTLGDNEKITFNSNLEIYTNGNDSYIQEKDASGALFIDGQNFFGRDKDEKNRLSWDNDNLRLYFKNDTASTINAGLATEVTAGESGERLRTQAGGIDVTGTVTADGGTIDGTLQVTKGNTLKIGDGTSSGGGLHIFQEANNKHTKIRDKGTGHDNGSLYIQANQLHLENEDGSKKYLRGMDDSLVIFDGKGTADSNVAIRPTDTDLIVYQRGVSFADAQNATGDAGTNHTRIIQSGSANADTTLTLPITTGNLLVDDGSGNVVVTGTVTASAIDLDDSVEITLGGTGNKSSIKSDTHLKLTSPDNIVLKGTDGAGSLLQVQPDGTNTVMQVSATGVGVTGTVTADALTMGDNEKITLGAGGDLEIYSDGATSFIEQPSGATGSDNLVIKGQNVLIKNDAGQEIIGAFSDVARLSNQGNVKLVTRTDGVEITGDLRIKDATDNVTTIQEGASGNITLTLPSATGTVALTSDIGFVAPTTVVGSAAIDDMTSNISKKYVHTGGAVTLKFPNVTASSNLGNTWVVVNAGTDTLTFDRVTSGTSQFKQLNGSTVATAANTITLSKGGVAELTVTADNEIIIFGSGVI